MKVRRFKVTAPGGPYMADIHEMSAERARIVFGGQKRSCVVIDLFPEDPLLSITSIAYDPKCNVSGTLEKGAGTRNLVWSALVFAKEMLPVMGYTGTVPEGAVFKDKSKIFSPDTPPQSYSLWAVSLLQHGQTWYQRMFDARPLIEMHAVVYEAMHREAQTTLPHISYFEPYLPSEESRAIVREEHARSSSIANLVQRLSHRLKEEPARKFECLREWPERWLMKWVHPEWEWRIAFSENLGPIHADEVPIEDPGAVQAPSRPDMFSLLDPDIFRSPPRKIGGAAPSNVLEQDLFGPLLPEEMRRLEEEGWL